MTLGRDANGNIEWNAEYDAFQRTVGFKTDLCKVAHPFTKGAVERLVRYVKENFLAARRFYNCNDLNRQALAWCVQKNQMVTKSRGLVPCEVHPGEGTRILTEDMKPMLIPYLAPVRRLSFDRYVQYEGRRYGVTSSYVKRVARVMRDYERLHVIDCDDYMEVASYDVDWAKADKPCPGQWDYGMVDQPEEHPTAPVRSTLRIATDAATSNDLSRFSLFAAIDDKEAPND